MVDRKTFDTNTSATINTLLDVRIASIFLERTGPGQVLGVELAYRVLDQADVRAVTVDL
jgi:hypothetical protein